MDVRLEVVHDKSRVRRVRLRRDTVVGRGQDCQLRIPVADVSRRHCQFTIDGDRLLLRDLGSSNGTQLDDKSIPVGKDILLSDGDTVTVGPVSFVVLLTDTDDANPAVESDETQQRSPLLDTAEFIAFEQTPDPQPAFSPDIKSPDSSTPNPGNQDLVQAALDSVPQSPGSEPSDPDTPPEDGVLEDDDAESLDPTSVIELELSSSNDISGDVVDDSDSESEFVEPPEPPLKSRSLFGLFRRHTTTSDDVAITDDDLMEEPGADPPADLDAEPASPDSHIGPIADHQTGPAVDTAVEPNASESIFEDDTSPEETSAAFGEADREEIAEEDDAASFDFLDDGSSDEATPDGDNPLNDFLGQFGD